MADSPWMFPAPIARSTRPRRGAYAIAVAASLTVWLLPLLAVALTSVRSMADLNAGNYWGVPAQIHARENFAAVISAPHMLQFLLNSVLITLPCVIGTVLLASMAGFALAKHRFRGNRLLLVMFIAGNLVPFQALMIPVRNLMIALGLYDSRWALILFHTAFQTGFCTLFMRNFIRALPDHVLDAARVDGAGELVVFWRVVLPLVRPAMAAVSVLIFTFVWNDYFWSLVLVQSDDVRPLTAGLQNLRGMWQTAWNLVCAVSLLAAAPPVVLFWAMQRDLMAGLALTSARASDAPP